MTKNERLRQQRIHRNWRLHELAEQLGVATSTVKRWEQGSHRPSRYYRLKLCDLFGQNAQELGLETEIVASSSANESPAAISAPLSTDPIAEERPCWTVPYARNPNFTGRDGLLSRLLRQRAPQEPEQITTGHHPLSLPFLALTGLGGIGKTQIAIEYAYRAREQGHYLHTIWINAASEKAILTSFLTLANQHPDLQEYCETDQQKLIAAVRHWLEHAVSPWLLIIDNVDDLSSIPAYLPRYGNGCILMTTRSCGVGALAISIPVDNMSVEEGTELLQRRAQLPAPTSEGMINETRILIEALARFPLALDQAGAYIEETGCNVHDYLQIYQKHRHALLARRGTQAMGYSASVATTWSFAFEHIQQTNPAAMELLHLCAFLAPDHIPEELFTEGATYWPAALQQAVVDRFTFNQVIEALLRFSLVKRRAVDRRLSIHHQVQTVLMERLPQQEQRQWAERLIRAIHLVFPHDPTGSVATWSQCQRYLEQAQACNLLIQQYQIQLPEATEVLDRVGTYLRTCIVHAC